MQLVKINEGTAALRRVPFFLVSDADGRSPATGISPAASEVRVSKRGGAEADSTGSVTEIAGGYYYYAAASGEVDTAGYLTLRIFPAGTVPQIVTVQVVGFDPHAALSTLDAAGVRTAVGLATANLDTQLSTISTKTSQLTFTTPLRVDATATVGGVPTADEIAQAIADLGVTSIEVSSPTSADGGTMTVNQGDSYPTGLILTGSGFTGATLHLYVSHGRTTLLDLVGTVDSDTTAHFPATAAQTAALEPHAYKFGIIKTLAGNTSTLVREGTFRVLPKVNPS